MWNEVPLRHEPLSVYVPSMLARIFRNSFGIWIVIEAGLGLEATGSFGARVLTALVAGVVASLLGALAGVRDEEGGYTFLAVVFHPLALAVGLLVLTPVGGLFGATIAWGSWWMLIVATLAAVAVAFQVGRVAQTVANGGGPVLDEAIAFGGALLAFGGLWLADLVLGGVSLAGSLAEQLATLAVLAALFRIGGSHVLYFFGLPFLVFLLPLLLSGLKLWLLGFVGQWTAAAFSIDGFWTLVLAALIVTAATAPIWLFEQWRHDRLQEEQLYEEHLAMNRSMQAQSLNTLGWGLDAARRASMAAEEWRRGR